MKILVTEDSLKINVGGELRAYVKNDEVTVDDDIGRLACANGWAQDVAGEVETGPRVPGAGGRLAPDPIRQKLEG